MSAESIEGVHAFQGMASLLLPVFAFLALLIMLSGFVLLIGCANIAGLLIGRAAARQREIAMRLALGAGRRRLVRQLLTESLLLAVLGGAAGVLLAIWFVGSAGAIGPRLPIPIDLDLRIDRRVLAYALGLSTFTSLLFGLAPAWSAARFDLVSSLKDDSAGSTARQRLRRVMIVGQVAICTALLVWSGLFLRSLRHVGDINPGFDPSGVLLATVALEEGVVDEAEGDRLLVEWTQRLTASAGVQSAGLSSIVPLALMGREEFSVSIPGDAPGTRRRVVASRVSPGWFETVRIPLRMGRDFTWDDRKGAPWVAIVNETLARQFWNGEAIGQRVNYGDRPLEIVGVVRDSKYRTIGETIRPMIYLPFRQVYMPEMTLHVRTTDMSGTRAALTRAMRDAGAGADGGGRADGRRGRRRRPPRADRRGRDRRVRRGRDAARGAGHLRARLVQRRPADAGDWRAQGHRRTDRGHPPARRGRQRQAPRRGPVRRVSAPACSARWGSGAS